MISPHTVTNFFKNLNKIFLLALVLFTFQQSIQPVYAAGTPLSGYAWSSNIGWISFASQGEGTIAYGVSLQPQSGVTRSLTGYAWNDQVGWIYFDPSLGGPGGGGDAWGARLNTEDGKFSGWAQVCAVFTAGSNGINECGGGDDVLKASTELGGWDGWIKFGDGTTYFGQVDVSTAPTQFRPLSANPTDYAWGSNVIGWISFCDDSPGGVPANAYCVKIGSMATSCQVVYEVPAGQPGCPAGTYPNGCSFVNNGDTITWHGSETGGAPVFDLAWSGNNVNDSLSATALTYLDSESTPYTWTPGSPPPPLAQSATFSATDSNDQPSECLAETTVIFSDLPPPSNTGTQGLLSDPTADTIRITSQPLTSAAISSHTSFHSLETSTTTTAFIVSMDSASNPGNPSLSLLGPVYDDVISCRLAPDYLDPLGPGNPSAQFSSCSGVNMPLLPLSSSRNEAYFNIRVATSTPNLNRYSPYRVKISASSTCTGVPSDWSGCSDVFKSFLFDYAVGTLNPI